MYALHDNNNYAQDAVECHDNQALKCKTLGSIVVKTKNLKGFHSEGRKGLNYTTTIDDVDHAITIFLTTLPTIVPKTLGAVVGSG